MPNYTNKTKIVATIGPATSSKEQLKKIFNAGVNVCRLNFSHGSHRDHLQVINNILELNHELGTNVAMLGDLQGPKLRIGDVENNGVELIEGAEIAFVNEKCMGTAEKVYMSYELFPKDVAIGDIILIDDGKLKLEATYTNQKDTVKAKVIHGGKLSSKKGVNLPNTKISLPSLTEKDFEDAKFIIEQQLDWVALSFVRSAKDMDALKKMISDAGVHTRVIAKIEKPEAIESIDGIIEAADGIMVARGDLGVELPFAEVPMMQKMIVEKTVAKAKPVIIATQMMESMIENFAPTRAEANDVANAVIDGASAVMLSGETSVGKYPVEVIQAMRSIICNTEKNAYKYYRKNEPEMHKETYVTDMTCAHACKMARGSNVKAIIAVTYSIYDPSRLASHRPEAKIYAFSTDQKLLRQMSMLWGVRGFFCGDFMFTNDTIEYTLHALYEQKLIDYKELVVHVGTLPFNKKGESNMVKLSYYDEKFDLEKAEFDKAVGHTK